MPKQRNQEGLGARERQIMDTIYRLGEASVSEILEKLTDPPSYSSVRTMVRMLEKKGLLRHRQEGTKYVYRPTRSHQSASRSALVHLMQTFFGNSAGDTVAAILDVSATKLTEEDLQRLEQLIDQARREGK